MPTIKLTTWNVEHLDKLLPAPGANLRRLQAIAQEITEIAPDILCLVEGPGNLPDLRAWVKSPQGLQGRYHVATIPGTDDILAGNPADPRQALQELYAMQGTAETGHQWIWFLVRDGLFQEGNARILNPQVWRDLTMQTSWPVHDWGKLEERRHSHWRHPQVLLIHLAGTEIEIIGVHLKSKINRKKAFDENGEMLNTYVEEAMRARVRLTTEAYDVRRYIDRRFQQDPSPRIFVCGDMNDGPGRGFFEREFLFFDLVSNIQGDVFFARRFLNHALFDYDDALCWSTNFHDKVEDWSRQKPGAEALPPEAFDSTRFQLIDHILFTQPLVGETAMPRVKPKAGLVEHTTQQRINAMLKKADRTSDHTPVSVHITC
jgi:endonuclease/exonuclease/phosphatase family metal-dependent hydrolase